MRTGLVTVAAVGLEPTTADHDRSWRSPAVAVFAALPEVEEPASQGYAPRQHSVHPTYKHTLLAPLGDSGRDAHRAETMMFHQLAECRNRHRMDVSHGMAIQGIPMVHADDLFTRHLDIA